MKFQFLVLKTGLYKNFSHSEEWDYSPYSFLWVYASMVVVALMRGIGRVGVGEWLCILQGGTCVC